MIPTSDAIPVARRLTGLAVIPGLACVLCLAIVMRPSIGGFQDYYGIVYVVLALLLCGAWVLRTMASATQCAVDRQLSELTLPTGPDSTDIRDTSELSSIESRLDESLRSFREARFHRFLNTLPDGMALCEPGGEISFANESLRALMDGDDDADPVGTQMTQLLRLDRNQNGRDALEQLENTTRNVVVEFRCGSATTDGVLRIACYPVSDDGQIQGYLWSVRDITQQTLAEEMREHFVSSATHELRTPLANIRAYAETLLMNDDIDIEQEKAFINTINSEADRLSRFVDDLLNVSQMQAGSLTLDRHETDIERLTMEVDSKVRPLMDQKKIDFELLIPPKLPKLAVDKDKLSAALVNLLGNAAKYTPDGGRVKFHIDVSSTDIQFHIEDSGIGIADEELARVFEKFFRSDDRRVRDVEGNGLGLTFTQEIIRLHGGRMDVHSELDKGSRFSIHLPV